MPVDQGFVELSLFNFVGIRSTILKFALYMSFVVALLQVFVINSSTSTSNTCRVSLPKICLYKLSLISVGRASSGVNEVCSVLQHVKSSTLGSYFFRTYRILRLLGLAG